jgi:hypothetical protein
MSRKQEIKISSIFNIKQYTGIKEHVFPYFFVSVISYDFLKNPAKIDLVRGNNAIPSHAVQVGVCERMFSVAIYSPHLEMLLRTYSESSSAYFGKVKSIQKFEESIIHRLTIPQSELLHAIFAWN